jgi:uncharacterized membrane protein YczE
MKAFFRLFVGLFLFALGMVLTVNAHLGLQPWDVLHQGLAKVFHITMGPANIIVSLMIVLINRLLGEKIGVSTLANALFVGIFFDLIMVSQFIPVYRIFSLRILMMFTGLLVIAIATYFYLSAGYGAGPRDGLMMALTKNLNKPVGLVRIVIESSVLIIGLILGGEVGGGTFIMAFLIGPFIQVVFQINHYNVKKVRHRYLDKSMIQRLHYHNH